MTIYEEATRTSKNALDGTLQSFAVVAKGLQQIASETSEFGKRSYEHQMTMLEQLLQARSVDKSLELQNDFAKSIYQSWVSQATKLSEIYADMAREAYKPLEQAALGTYGRGVEYTRETSQATVKAAKAAVDKPAAA
ncbi:phasin family protein [Aurantimonas sp. HBX-1]|uniref:phasin family protein n=1 Tax=Aurantimonas sp. HBX-1 TaxID=2906072 RepID=UPI001F3E833C|nr:phasin family protein [Aurantimonas sp. HBX-1]UIJ73781.1 phasin family protein [Aurantimonas sp. HBX-1]